MAIPTGGAKFHPGEARAADTPGAREDFEADTRAVFDVHHRLQSSDAAVFNRLKSLISPEYFQLQPEDFAGMKVLDAGCGSNANASVAFLELGAEVHSIDLGCDWMECAAERLSRHGERSTMGSESVLDLSLPDGEFEFVHCAGVLHHTRDPRKGFEELVRVTRPGGRVFISVMANGNGLLYQCINLMRQRYAIDGDFRRTIDVLDAEALHRGIDWLLRVRGEREPEGDGEEEAKFLHSLVDEDLVLTIKDRLQAPTYHGFGFTEVELKSWFESAGLINVQRLTRYVRGFQNLRRFLAPLYFHHDHPLARFWLGDGYVQLIGQKPS